MTGFADRITAYLQKLFGIEIKEEIPLYTSLYEKRGNNEYTAELEKLFDEVTRHTPAVELCASKQPFPGDSRIQAVYFDGEKCLGKAARVFAYIGFPENASESAPVPAVVYVHGGGQHANADAVKFWVNNGYAAISFDGFGQEPVDGSYIAGDNSPYWKVSEKSHLPFDGLADPEKPFEEQWFYYYICDIILANNILRSDGRVKTDCIGITGVSWGGYAISAAIGYDSRFAFAVPFYGVPYSDKSTSFFSSVVPSEQAHIRWEPSLRTGNIKTPVLFINGADDPFFSANCTTSAAADIENASAVFIDGIQHGEYARREAVRFADEVTGRGEGNIKITALGVENGKACVKFTSPSDIKNKAVYIYYKKTGLDYDGIELTEKWQCKKGVVIGSAAKVKIPSDAYVYYICVTGHEKSIFSKSTVSASTGIFYR